MPVQSTQWGATAQAAKLETSSGWGQAAPVSKELPWREFPDKGPGVALGGGAPWRDT